MWVLSLILCCTTKMGGWIQVCWSWVYCCYQIIDLMINCLILLVRLLKHNDWVLVLSLCLRNDCEVIETEDGWILIKEFGGFDNVLWLLTHGWVRAHKLDCSADLYDRNKNKWTLIRKAESYVFYYDQGDKLLSENAYMMLMIVKITTTWGLRLMCLEWRNSNWLLPSWDCVRLEEL